MSRVPFTEFVVLNVAGAALWAVTIGILGYIFGHGLEWVLEDIRRFELAIFLLILLTGLLVWVIHAATTRKKRKPSRLIG